MASARRRRNHISKLVRDDGVEVTDQQDLCEVARGYFANLFHGGEGEYGSVVDHVQPRVSADDNHLLVRPLEIEEFKQALFQMHSDKSPGPDGLNPAFFKKFWNLCGVELFNIGREWLAMGEFPPNLNDANIVLIPKVEDPTSMKDLRPISLCNVIYKIISKVLANRLKPLLPKFISLEQSAFVENRSILDNVLVAFETLHHLKCKTMGKKGEMALKIDISKAYDRVDWVYLNRILVKMGFDEQWVRWMQMCLETVTYSVMVNGEKVGPIIPGRGLRQGDPLSPYLFILCAEGLTTLLQRAESRGDIHGVKVCRGAPPLSHLLFADDCFLFCRADARESRHLKDILNTYERASGQAINLQKSEIYFSRNTSQEARFDVTAILGVTECLGTGKYLGLPSMIGRNKKQLFGYLRDRIWRKIHHWSGKHLSKAGREVLIKSVAQSIPTYCMSTFMLPSTLGEELERMMNSFWWGTNRGTSRGIHWLSWEKLSVRKEFGGMGFRHLHGFNLAMLGKQAWHLATRTDTIVSRVFKAKYYPNDDFMGARLGHNPSFVWRSIFSSRVVVNLGARWRIGNGDKISVWRDPWLKGRSDSFVRSPMVQGMEEMRVKDLMHNNNSGWNYDLIDQLFCQEEAMLIKSMPRFSDLEEDKFSWWRSRSGHYSVRSAYYALMDTPGIINNSHARLDGDWMSIWKAGVPPKVKLLIWRLARGCLPTRSNLVKRHVNCTILCPFCEREEETDSHVFIECSAVQEVWRKLNLLVPIRVAAENAAPLRDVIFSLLSSLSVANKNSFLMCIWALWRRRNDKVWAGVLQSVEQVVHAAKDMLESWSGARQQQQRAAVVSGQQVPRVLRWIRPAVGTLKCNIDAAIFAEENKYGIGVCIRSSTGDFYRGKTMWFHGVPTPQEAEAIGLKETLTWLEALGLSSVSIELDCASVVNGLKVEPLPNTEFGTILLYCRNRLLLFPSFKVSYIRRQANLVAHTLARASRLFANSHVFDLIPTCIETILLNEMN